MKSQMTNSERRIYNRDDMIRLFYCPKDIPDYLKEFAEILNDNVNDLWYKKPLPKFEEAHDGKHRPPLTGNKFKARQRTTSSQSGENAVDSDATQKFRTQNNYKEMKPRNEKFIRYNVLNGSETMSNKKPEHDTDSGWQTVEPRPFKMLSKQYASNNQVEGNHWKKWNKERTISDDNTKIATPSNRNERTNNFVVKKIDAEPKQDNIKVHASKSFSTASDQTEDIWLDDLETEMQSKIATTPEEPLEAYELPPPSVAMSLSIPVHRSISVDYDLWFYKDLGNTVQGPFQSESMANWLATGYFDYSTCLRRKCDERFLLLAEYRALYGRIPFTVGATIPPILKDTTINIDPTQLIAGLDMTILQKVLANATSLSPNIMPFVNTMAPHDNGTVLVNEVEKNARLEEERKLEQSKADLERERQRFIDERDEWKIQMEQEMEIKMQLFMRQAMEQNKVLLANTEEPVSVQLTETAVSVTSEMSVEDVTVKEDTPVVTVERANRSELKLKLEDVDDLKGGDWVSKKALKNVKNVKKSKNKVVNSSPESLPTPELKKNDKENFPRIIKESGNLRIIERDSIVESKKMEKPTESPLDKPEVVSSWNCRPAIPKVETTQITKSLLEIQAEETEKEKVKRELDKAVNLSRVEASKVTSFKDSLLKSVRPAKTPLIPSGKSIWDIQESTVVDQVVVRTVEPTVVTKDPKTRKPSEDYERVLLNNNNDGLYSWCCQKLTKFSKELDVFTVVELLREVPIDNVCELTCELLDDSVFSRNFARDFVKKREELSLSAKEEPWQLIPTVKKPTPVTVQSTTKTAGGKTKSKKKMVVIDHTKFKSG